MKKLKYFIILAIAVSAMASCGKDGATGPAGPTGATGTQGPVGPAGPTGAAGANGSVIYSGTTVPPSTTGAVGDYYLNKSTGLFYGPKTSGGWGTGFSLKGTTGAAGAAGTAGSKIYNGTSAPASTLGAVGDYYLNTANYMFYGPKTSAGWAVPISLQGPEGNANVQTTVFSLTNAQWLWNSTYEFQTNPSSYTEYFTRYADNTVSAITQDILDNGEVMVYFTPNTSDNTNQWAPLPYEFSDGSQTFNYEIAYETNVGTLRLHYFFVQTVSTATIPVLSTYTIATYKFKVLAISGILVSALKKNHVDMNDYNAVSKFTGLWQKDNNQ